VSQASVAVVRRWFGALEDGNPAPDMCDPEIEITNWAESPVTGPYRGHEGVARWWEDVTDAFQEFRWELLSIEAIDDDRCLTVQRIAGRFRHTGIDLDFVWGAIITVRDDKILSAVGYASPRRARSAAGLG
jgi:ketosteroid isomerase-like protein